MPDRLQRRLRRVGSDLPAPAKSVAQAALSAVDPVLIWRYRRQTGYADPIPPIALRARLGSPSIAAFLRNGEVYGSVLPEVLQSTGRSLDDFASVLDFGAGCGRVLVPLWRRWGGKASFHGCDIDQAAVAWLRAHYPGLPVEINRFRPPLPYSADSFDLLYSFSVFSHLDEEAQFDWLAEIGRVLRPGGVALLTVHGEAAFRRFASGEAVGAIRAAPARLAARSLAERGFVFEEAEWSRWNALRFIGEGRGWGLAFHSEDYLRTRWTEFFRSLDIVTGKAAQDFVLVT
jgi:SAM-dependent methyltransferase